MEKLLLDVDEVICDPGFLYLINKFLDTNYQIDDFTEYYIDDVLGDDKNKQDFYRFFLKYNSYDYATIYPYVKEVLEKLNKLYDIYICSACVNPFFVNDSASQFANKYNFLIDNFPYLNPNKFIFTGVKNMFKADIQIDDRLSHLEGDIPMKFLFPSYHNKNHTIEELNNLNVIRLNNTRDDAWLDIEKRLVYKK